MSSQNVSLMSLCNMYSFLITKKTVYFDVPLEIHKAKIITTGMVIQISMQMWVKK